jgi:protein ImuB
MADRAAPRAIVASSSGALRVLHCDAVALRAGVRSGQTLAEALALAPQLVHYADDAAGDREALEQLAEWADALSPVVHIEGADTLLVDVTGCARLFGGEDRLLARAHDAVVRRGYTVRAALVDTPGAAWALAHHHDDGRVLVPFGRTAAGLARLPVTALRIEPAVAKRLRLVGVETIETLLHLPRAALPARFGENLLHRLDQALGDAPEILTPYRAPAEVRAALRFPMATDRRDVLALALARIVAEFAAELTQRNAGTRHVHVTFYFPCGSPVTVPLPLARATRDPAHLQKLLDVRLESFVPSEPVEAMVVWTRSIENLDGAQATWFDVADGGEALADLWDRLGARLGSDAIVRAKLVDEHVPEAAYAYVPVVDEPVRRRRAGLLDAAPAEAPRSRTSTRPLRMLPRPVLAPVMAVVPDGPPLRFRFHGRDHVVSGWTGPERIETGWWRGPPVARDYFRVESDNGCHYWLFRERRTGRWFVQGTFD